MWYMVINEPTKSLLRLYNSTFSSMKVAFKLGYIGGTHLWTCPIEIKYYFVIPIIAVVTMKMARFWFLFVIILLSYVFYVETYNSFNFNQKDYFSASGRMFAFRFNYFLLGSILAIFYFNIIKYSLYQNILNNSFIQKIISFLIVVIFMLQFRLFSGWNKNLSKGDFIENYLFKTVLYECLLIYLLIACKQENFIIKFLNSKYMTLCGKFSFGIYLFHPTIILYNSYYAAPFRFLTVIYINLISFVIGGIWFYVLENNLMKIANLICKRL